MLEELEDELRSLVLRVLPANRRPEEEVAFHLDDGEASEARKDRKSLDALTERVLKRPGFFQGRREQTSTRRALVERVWEDAGAGHALDRDDAGDLWMTVTVAPNWAIEFRLHPGEAASAADPRFIRDLADRAKACPHPYRLRPPERWVPGRRKRVWQDLQQQWFLERDDDGGLVLVAVIYQGFTAWPAEVRLEKAAVDRCRRSWSAAARLGERLSRNHGRGL